jgi:dTDP-4-dehydrorhamnose 3,5-epimerase
VTQRLPAGVSLTKLETHHDHRGSLTEIFRVGWIDPDASPAQWNFTVSEAGVLRGVHLHLSHTDYLVVAEGRADIGLRDVRRGSPTDGLATIVAMNAEEPSALTIPPGVIHGLHFRERSIVLYGLSEEWDLADDLACRWDDPDVGIPCGVTSPTISERDAGAPSLRDLLAAVEHAQPIGGASEPSAS